MFKALKQKLEELHLTNPQVPSPSWDSTEVHLLPPVIWTLHNCNTLGAHLQMGCT